MTTRPPAIFDIPDGTRVTACSACQGAIVFVKSKKTGKAMPLEALDRVANGKTIKRGESHFAYCPRAGDFRRPR